MRILGLDPGLNITGYACIDSSDPVGRDAAIVEAGVFRLGKDGSAESTRSARTVSARLVELERDLAAVIDRLRPSVAAVESLFAHYNHPATAIIMGHARGVMLLTIRRAGLDLMEFKPNEVKKSLTGHGLSQKGQMQRAIQARFNLAEPPRPPDVADAIAIALCAAGRLGSPEQASAGGVKSSRRARRATSAELARLLKGRG